MLMQRKTDNLRICIVGELVGGVGIYTQNLIRGLSMLGVRPTILTPTPEFAPIETNITKVFRIPGRCRWLLQALAFAKALEPVRDKFDVIHFTDARNAVFVPAIGSPLLGTMNDYFYTITGWNSPEGTKSIYKDWRLRHLYYNILRTVESRCLERYRSILCISKIVRDLLCQRYGIDSQRLIVIPYGIEYGRVDSEPLSKEGPMILFAGGNFQRKGLGVLIQASTSILREIPDARFVILGKSRDERIMKKMCYQFNVAKAFQFVGQVNYETLYRYYRTADIFVMPSILEAFGIPHLEAMHCGVPVIASDTPGPDDFLLDGFNSLLSKVRDADSLACCILRALRDEDLRTTLIRNGLITAKQFTVRRMAEQTLAIYRSA